MSSVYVLEPPTKGKLVLTTTLGDLDIELWAKEAPKTVRNFVQLCLEGYYNDTIFHRVIKEFMVQGGDPTGTGTGGESIYGGPYGDEIHSRLRFTHRGLVASANAGTPDSNGSQFFITLDRCDWLNKKNTIFGKITGDTVYNLMRLSEVETDKNDRPLDPPRLISVSVLWNPFEDIIPRTLKAEQDKAAAAAAEAQKAAKPKKKNLNLLSFGEEAEEEEQELARVAKPLKIRSSHDVLDDPRFLKRESGEDAPMDEEEVKRRAGLKATVRQALTAGKDQGQRDAGEESTSDGEGDDRAGGDFDARMRRQILERRKQMGDAVKVPPRLPAAAGTREAAAKPRPRPPDSDDDDDDDDDEDGGGVGSKERKRQKDALRMKKKGTGSEARSAVEAKPNVDTELLSPLEQRRALYKNKTRTLQGRQEATLAKLAKFKEKVQGKGAEDKEAAAAVQPKPEEEEDDSWLATHKLKFAIDPKQRDTMARNEDPNQYVVHDPLLEKGKEKFNKMQAKEKKRGREWAGRAQG